MVFHLPWCAAFSVFLFISVFCSVWGGGVLFVFRAEVSGFFHICVCCLHVVVVVFMGGWGGVAVLMQWCFCI